MAGVNEGWHPDPSGVFEHRYWDGTRWTERVAVGGNQGESPLDAPLDEARGRAQALALPGKPGARTVAATSTMAAGPVRSGGPPAAGASFQAADSSAAPALDDRPVVVLYAVTIVLAALGIGLVLLVDPQVGRVLARWIKWGVILALAAVIRWDLKRNPALARRFDAEPNLSWVIYLAPPLHLVYRRRFFSRSAWPVVGYFGLTLIALFGPRVVATDAGTRYSAVEVEQLLEADVEGQLGVGADATCPDRQPKRPGHAFSCDLRVGGKRYEVQLVTVEDDGLVIDRILEP